MDAPRARPVCAGVRGAHEEYVRLVIGIGAPVHVSNIQVVGLDRIDGRHREWEHPKRVGVGRGVAAPQLQIADEQFTNALASAAALPTTERRHLTPATPKRMAREQLAAD